MQQHQLKTNSSSAAMQVFGGHIYTVRAGKRSAVAARVLWGAGMAPLL